MMEVQNGEFEINTNNSIVKKKINAKKKKNKI